MSLHAMLAAAVAMAGLWTNEEQVRFAEEAGASVPAWVGLRVEPAGGAAGEGWRATPVDPFGAQLGPARALAAAEVTADGLRIAGEGRVVLDMRQARAFRCWAAIPKAGTDPVQWWSRREIALHDQGGRAVLQTDETVPQQFELRMRNVVWPSGPNQPSLVLYVHTPAGGARAVAYSWADPGARRVGLNLRTIQASCSLVE